MISKVGTLPRFKSYDAGAVPRRVEILTQQQLNLWNEIPSIRDRSCDVLVYGGGLSGVAAAVSVARRGYKVVLVEPTHMLGGQSTAAGVSAFDITFHYDHLLNDHGIWGELVSRIISIYDDELLRPVNVGHYRNNSLTPNVVVTERAITELVCSENINVLRNTSALACIQSGGEVRGLVTTAGAIRSKITIDASEDGVLLAKSGTPHRLSNGLSNGSSEWGIRSPRKAIQDITYTATIRLYPDGIPSSLRVQSAPRGYAQLLPVLRVRYPKSGVIDPQKNKYGPLGFAGFRAAPDLASDNMHVGSEWEFASRTNINYYNDYPVSSDYLTNKEYRLKCESNAMQMTLSIIYYLQNELGLDWSVATDEGFADGPARAVNPYLPNEYRDIVRHFPLIPYIRESRRVIGLSTISGRDIAREPNRSIAKWNKDSVVVGTYHPDLHGGREAHDFETYLGESLEDKPTKWREGPFPIPLGSLIPLWTDGLIMAEKNISTTRLANGATRLHPTVSSIGEAAGVLACSSIKYNLRPRDVHPCLVQFELAKGGAALGPLAFEGMEADDPRYPEVALAVVRERVSFRVLRRPGKEPKIVVDLDAAYRAGKFSISFARKNNFRR